MRYDARAQANALFGSHGEKLPFPPPLASLCAVTHSMDKLPIQVRAASEERTEKERERVESDSPSFLPSFFPFSPFLVHIMSPQLSPFIHTCARLALGEGGRKGGKDGPHIATPLLTTSSDLPICRARRELQGAVKRRSMPLGSAEEGDTRLIFGKEHVQFRLVIDPERGLQ